LSQQSSDHVLAFDTLYTNNHIQMLKVLLPHLPRKQKNEFAVFIKYMELQYTIALSKKTKHQINICTASTEDTSDISSLIDELQPYCTEQERKTFSHMAETFQTLHMFQDLQKYKDLFATMSTPEDSSTGNANPDISQMLKNMLSPEQQTMFEMFQNQSFSE